MSMNTSQFMDKQITEFSATQTTNVNGAEGLSDSPNPRGDQNHGNSAGDGPHGDGEIEEEIDPRYDFQPIRTFESQTAPPPTTPPPQPMDSSSVTRESSRVMREEKNVVCDDIMVTIDHAIKRHSDNLLYSLEGISTKLAQLESRTRLLENSLDVLKMSIGDTVDKSDGKLKQLESILIEVKTGVQVLRDKKEDEESRQLSKNVASQEQAPLHQSFQQPNHIYISPQHHPTPPQQSFQQPHQTNVPQQPPIHFAPPVENAAPTPPQQNTFPQQISGSVPQTEIPFVPSVSLQQSFHLPDQPHESTQQQYQVSVHQPPTHQHYQMPPQYSQPPQTKPLFPIKSEGRAEYATPQHQTYPSMIRPHSMVATSQPPPSGHPQQFYGPNPSTYEPSSRRNGYGPPPIVAVFPEPHNYSGSPSRYNSKPSPFSSSSGGGNNLQRLPIAKLLPQSTPVGSSSNGSTGNRVPIDDVVDKVATMGFSREQVKETVKRLTENGQSVDLNVVLDKLMNGG